MPSHEDLDFSAGLDFESSIITKSHLILQDIDILSEMAAHNLIHVNLSITTLNQTLFKKMEPRASSPGKRIECLRSLSAANIPTGVMFAPLIPGLNYEEMDYEENN